MIQLPEKTEVLIVGAGPTGLALAGELLRRGIEPLLIDVETAPSTFIKGSVISSRTLEMFEELGFYEQARKLGTVVHEVVLWAEGKRAVVGDMGLLDAPHAFNLHLGQPYTEKLLTAALQENGGRIDRELELVDFTADEQGVTAELRQGKTMSKVRAAWLVGCDGARSTVRKKLGFHLEGQTYPVDYILGNIKLDWKEAQDVIHLFFTREGSLTVNPLPDGLTQIAGDLPHEEGDQRTQNTPSLADLQDVFDRRSAIPGRLADPRRITYYRSHQRRVKKRVLGRVMLAGDAAHLVSPNTGLGMNTGLQDTWNLGWKLAAVIRGEAEPRLLESYNEERQAVLVPLGKMSDMNEKLYSLRGRVAQELRDHLATTALHFEALWRRNVRDLTQISVNYHNLSLSGEQLATPLHLPGKHLVAGGHCTKAWLAFGKGPQAGNRVVDARPVTRDGDDHARLLPFRSATRHVLLLFTGNAAPPPKVCDALVKCAAASRKRLGDQVRVDLIVPGNELPASCQPIAADQVIFDPVRTAHDRYGAVAECLYFCRCDGFIGFRSLPPDAAALENWFDTMTFMNK